tara:strand:+ start:1706 stop:2047 length:342 start_codon:yes stop_codon:yes gene_type:complete
MKNIILIPVLALVLFSVEATAQNKNLEAQKVETSVDEQNLTTVHFKITGITCAGCSNGIYKAVKAVDGVKEHSVEYPGDIAIIQFDKTKTSMEALKAVIEKKGYKVELLKDKV